MKRIESLSSISPNTYILTGIDMTGNLKQLFRFPLQMPGCLFLLCIRGNCTVTIHLTQYEVGPNSLAIIMPEFFFQITSQSHDCRFILVGFSKELIRNSTLFSKTIEYTPQLFEKPVMHLQEQVADVFAAYFKTLVKATRLSDIFANKGQADLIYSQIILALGNINKQGCDDSQMRYNRNQEIVKELVRTIVQYYKSERNISFYAEKMHLSPQHLSTTIKKTTGKTLTDIISSFVIHDAQAKLRSTELTIQEIAYSLNFPDISFFGKYFKRYTGMSPKQYRNSEE